MTDDRQHLGGADDADEVTMHRGQGSFRRVGEILPGVMAGILRTASEAAHAETEDEHDDD